MRYHGGCHCGRIAFDVEGELTQVMECNCSHCSKKGFLLWFVPREQLVLATPESDMSAYTFHKHVIQHRFCPQCGCAPISFGIGPNGKAMAGVNVRCLEGVDTVSLKHVQIDGRSF
jgi:hypothetical protein